MRKTIFLLILISFQAVVYSQKKKNNVNKPTVSTATFNVTKSSRLVEKIKLNGIIYNVYLKSQKPSEMMNQKENDTLVEYHFTYANSNYPIIEIQQYATVNGKIAREGFYKVKNDTLITSVNYYDPYHGGNFTNHYISSKYGKLEEVKSAMKAIDSEILSDRYIKSEKMKSVYDPKQN